MSFQRAVTLAVLLPLGLACDSHGPSECLDGVSFTVGAGTEPTFDWAPACRMQALVILAKGPSPSFVWAVRGPLAGNVLEPPIRYGEVPPDAISNNPAPPLEEGTAYQVTLYASVDNPLGNGRTVQAVDSTVFVP
jgi:hypothetical protein